MEKVILPDETRLPSLGLGTWFMGEDYRLRQQEIAALQDAVRQGIRLIDTAEMYGSGAAEELIGDALSGLEQADRDKVFLVSKVLPFHAGRADIFKACEGSLRRLQTDHLDLYLLHWRGRTPFAETIACMEELIKEGKIRRWGVSNLDTEDMKELLAAPGGSGCQTDQVLYHLGSRGIEYELKPWLDNHRIPIMAYCPLAQGGRLKSTLLQSGAVREVAKNHGVSPIQVLLAFVLEMEQTIAIPKVSTPAHLQELLQVRELKLTAEEKAMLDKAFPAPMRKLPLDIV